MANASRSNIVSASASFNERDFLNKVDGVEEDIPNKIDGVEEDIRNKIDGIEEDVKKLHNTYVFVKAGLEDAEKRQLTEKVVRVWFERLTDISYEIDDALDLWKTAHLKDQISDAENTGGSNSYRLSDCSWVEQLAQKGDFQSRIRELKATLDDINIKKDAFKFKSDPVAAALPMPQHRESTSFIKASTVCGRDLEIKRLVENLYDTSQRKDSHEVISVVGMGGVGKTTVAQCVYNDATVKSHFQKRIWVCVSDPFDKVQVAKSIADKLDGNPSDFTDLQDILEFVNDSIAEKRYLLVLDDVWTEDSSNWESLLNSLDSGADGSKILVTTRKAKCAKAIGSTSVHPLGQLSAEESWKLFSQIAFFDKSDEDVENLKEVGQKIAKKCKGLPLALKAIASYLESKSNTEEWQKVLDSEIWELETAEKRIFPPLLPSYYDFPSPIKKCFLFCAVFPKDYQFVVDVLKRQWMSQGYLVASRNEYMETVGDEYFEHLLTRSFFQDFEYNEGTGARYVKMHDIVHDFAQFLSKDESLIFDMENKRPDLPFLSCRKLRHLTVLNAENSGVDVMSSFSSSIQQKLHDLHTLRISRSSTTGVIGKNFQKLSKHLGFIKALDLSDNEIIEVPEEIGQLVHLRYLDLSRNSKLDKLPVTIYELCNLQTLLLDGCRALRELPEGIEKLKHLRHLEFDYVRILPKGIESLSSLQTLSRFIVGRDEGHGGKVAAAATIGGLRKLNYLRGFLEITHLKNVKDGTEATKAELRSKRGLTRLRLNFYEGEGIGDNENEVIEALEPCHNLKALRIEPYNGKLLPRWISLLSKLRELDLVNCKKCEELPPLGQLPSLEFLRIYSMERCKRIGEEFLGIKHGQTSVVVSFPKLKELEFSFMKQWTEWNGGEDINFKPFPCLVELRMVGCPQLKSLPQFISKSPIQIFKLNTCPILEERCRRITGEDWCKISHIPDIRVMHQDYFRSLFARTEVKMDRLEDVIGPRRG